MPAEPRVLLVADRHADPSQLLTALRGLVAGSPRVSLLVPAFAAAHGAVGGSVEDWRLAIERAARCGERLRSAGVDLEETIVGDADPLAAAADADHARGYDQIVFATPAAGAVATAGLA
ncbi:MAG: hypothetical protein R2725_11210 [Solirubrobacterales bacterium]